MLGDENNNKQLQYFLEGVANLEIFKRLQKFDTVYKRAKDRHARDKTSWW
jgi:hypothetical protein